MLFPSYGQVAYALLTSPPLTASNINIRLSSFDLHVLCAPPAFILSQDQTLKLISSSLWLILNHLCLVVLDYPLYWFLKRFVVYFSMYFVLCSTTELFFIIQYSNLKVNTFFDFFCFFIDLYSKISSCDKANFFRAKSIKPEIVCFVDIKEK